MFQFSSSSPENSTYVVMRKSPVDPVYCWLIFLHNWIYFGCNETETAEVLGGDVAYFHCYLYVFVFSFPLSFFNLSQVKNHHCTTDDKQQGETKTKNTMMPVAVHLLISAFYNSAVYHYISYCESVELHIDLSLYFCFQYPIFSRPFSHCTNCTINMWSQLKLV